MGQQLCEKAGCLQGLCEGWLMNGLFGYLFEYSYGQESMRKYLMDRSVLGTILMYWGA